MAAVVTQMAQWLLPRPEVRGLNPVISKLYITNVLSIVFKKRK